MLAKQGKNTCEDYVVLAESAWPIGEKSDLANGP